MSISKSFINFGFLPAPDSQPSETRKSISLSSSSSSCLAIIKNHYQTRFWDKSMRSKKHYTSQRRFLVRSVVQPGAPPPSEPPFNFIKWIVGMAITVVLPFFSGKWTSLLKIKNEVDMAVEIGEEIVKAVEKAAEGVERAAENLAEDLPKDGGLRKAVDFIEHVAERANEDAHKLGDFIDKVQEAEEKVEDYVECIVEGAINHEHHKEDNQENEAEKDEENEAKKDEENGAQKDEENEAKKDEENGAQKDEENEAKKDEENGAKKDEEDGAQKDEDNEENKNDTHKQ